MAWMVIPELIYLLLFFMTIIIYTLRSLNCTERERHRERERESESERERERERERDGSLAVLQS